MAKIGSTLVAFVPNLVPQDFLVEHSATVVYGENLTLVVLVGTRIPIVRLSGLAFPMLQDLHNERSEEVLPHGRTSPFPHHQDDSPCPSPYQVWGVSRHSGGHGHT